MRSSSSEARTVVSRPTALTMTKVAAAVHRNTAATPMAWMPSCPPMLSACRPAPPRLSAANTPHSRVPSAPPTPCTANTSSESSIFRPCLIQTVKPKQTAPAARPMSAPPMGPTKPEAGVMATRPATAPVMMPSTFGVPCFSQSSTIQASAAAAVASWVTSMAMPASVPAATALPALKPNQPTHRIDAPSTLSVRLCGRVSRSGKPRRGSIMAAITRPAVPAVRCTTRPPANSSTPSAPSQPPPHTQCATGK